MVRVIAHQCDKFPLHAKKVDASSFPISAQKCIMGKKNSGLLISFFGRNRIEEESEKYVSISKPSLYVHNMAAKRK